MLPGDFQVVHRHPNEQIGYVLEGECELYVDGVKYIVKTGDTCHVLLNCESSWHAIGKESFSYVDFFTLKRADLENNQRFTYLDFFVPRRLDLVNGQFNFAKWTRKDQTMGVTNY